MDDLLARIELELSAGSVVFDVSLPADDGEAIAWLHRNTDVLSREDEEMLCHFRIRVAERRKGEVMQRFRGRLDPVAEPAVS
jgi:GTP-binding protein HflX